MNKTEFLEEISKMDRDQIRKVIETNPKTKIKRECPIIFFKKSKRSKEKK